MVRVTDRINISETVFSSTSDSVATAKMTNANSPPWGKKAARLVAEVRDRPKVRPSINNTTNFTAISPKAISTTSQRWSFNSPKFTDIPTVMKNKPSNNPLNGSMSASSAWRYSDSDSSTPARNAPRAMESPMCSRSRAVPSTTSNARAVNTSRTRVSAVILNT